MIDKTGRVVRLGALFMNRLPAGLTSLRSISQILSVALVLGGLAFSALAEPPKSLLPAFGPAGRQIEPKAKSGYDIRGWLPKDWVDNSSWAPVSIIYSELKDAPAEAVGALRIDVIKIDGFQAQLTTKVGARPYKQGSTYVLTGWVRSSSLTPIWVGFRQDEEPREFFLGRDLEVDTDWKRFTVEWKPEQDCKAWLFFNVTKNAMEAMRPGGKLTIRTRLDDDSIFLLFADSGSGIRQEDLVRLFQPYHTTKAGGHGLGLMIVQRIMRDHGGQIGLESKEGVGTVVTLQFPRRDRRVRMLQS